MHDHAADAFDDHLGLVGDESAEIAVTRARHAHRELFEMAVRNDVRRTRGADVRFAAVKAGQAHIVAAFHFQRLQASAR